MELVLGQIPRHAEAGLGVQAGSPGHTPSGQVVGTCKAQMAEAAEALAEARKARRAAVAAVAAAAAVAVHIPRGVVAVGLP